MASVLHEELKTVATDVKRRQIEDVVGSLCTAPDVEDDVRVYRLNCPRKSIFVMILQGIDTHYALLQGHAILGDAAPLLIQSCNDYLFLS